MKDIVETTKNLILEEKHELYEMARIGFTDDGFEVYVNTDDAGNIPHFHYRKGSYGKYKFHTCIKLRSAGYFSHTGKEDRLNSGQKKSLVKFLQSNDKLEPEKTVWEILLREWNRNNSKVNVDEMQSMPNYLNLR